MYGLRNPWRFSFDRANGDVWVGDVGQDAREEIDFVPAAGAAGVNWGWNALEGTRDFAPGDAPADARLPIFELSHDDGNCSVTGGYVYRGQAIPALHGAYVFADYCVGDLIALVQRDGALAEQALLDAHVDEVTSFAEDPNGELYVLSRGGSIFRIDPA
jgi:glucose/arabinose dehydrogenase